MFRKVLIANRGEIAIRVLRACRELGAATVAVVSEADRDSLHALLADEVVCVGPAASADSYLNMQNILSAALNTGAQAIHPGYGFLSENAEFAEVCRRCGLAFIGPEAESIRLMGDKSAAKATMKRCGVPTIPGSDGEVATLEAAQATADAVGYPVLIKASAGGGGRGIRRADNAAELKTAFAQAAEEARKYFGGGGLYIEKLLTGAKHVEIQILADPLGDTVYLGERDCSMQRRKQKMIEETPCSSLSEEQRRSMGEAAVRAAKAVNYVNAGTVEFLLAPTGEFYFMEMNTRIQVEHPITEMATGIDLVKAQIRIAAGERLGFTQRDIHPRGHAIECRVNAESPEHGFRPSSGTVAELHVPGGFNIRFDSQLYQGYTLPPHYDSMIGKLIVLDDTRENATAKMRCALSELIVDGIDTNINFQHKLVSSPEFARGQYTTDTVEQLLNKR